MRVVVALGGNALLKRGEPMTAEVQRGNVAVAARALVPIAREHELVLSHGNGPQVGNLFLMNSDCLWVRSTYTQSAPLSFISASIPRATASRVASSPRLSYFSMNLFPCSVISTPPSPRTASEIKKFFANGL